MTVQSTESRFVRVTVDPTVIMIADDEWAKSWMGMLELDATLGPERAPASPAR